MDKEPSMVVDAPPPPVTETEEGHGGELQEKEDGQEDGEEVRKPLWGPCECCISCVSLPLQQEYQTDKQVVTEYFHNENFEGVGQGISSSLSTDEANE
jgi:hypothetical protein